MNERIKELEDLAWEMAHVKSLSEGWDCAREDYFTQQFAGLIIQECVLLFDSDSTTVSDDLKKYNVRGIIKQHFGVE